MLARRLAIFFLFGRGNFYGRSSNQQHKGVCFACNILGHPDAHLQAAVSTKTHASRRNKLTFHNAGFVAQRKLYQENKCVFYLSLTAI